ncbi:hypothetical protein Scep_004402 [Stephania cephalantha]|uniref:Uncharacterized protein n=1 Tax=Stephania cephalantha TaxID=152367 RepID=A0AAP0KSE5_9MAGN
MKELASERIRREPSDSGGELKQPWIIKHGRARLASDAEAADGDGEASAMAKTAPVQCGESGSAQRLRRSRERGLVARSDQYAEASSPAARGGAQIGDDASK